MGQYDLESRLYVPLEEWNVPYGTAATPEYANGRLVYEFGQAIHLLPNQMFSIKLLLNDIDLIPKEVGMSIDLEGEVEGEWIILELLQKGRLN